MNNEASPCRHRLVAPSSLSRLPFFVSRFRSQCERARDTASKPSSCSRFIWERLLAFGALGGPDFGGVAWEKKLLEVSMLFELPGSIFFFFFFQR